MVTDEELIQSYKQGNMGAFEAFVHRYHSSLLGFLLRTVKDPTKAEDFTQETFIRLMKQVKRDEVPKQIKPWMYRVALNLCRDYWRSSRYRSERYDLESIPDLTDTNSSVVEIYEKLEDRKQIIAALEQLSEDQRHIIILRFYQELKLQEIAEALEMPLSTVKTNLYKGLKMLKSLLSKGKEGAIYEGKF
ncbi:RNA polymerase sigma factor [Evansella sp. AB-P1]|uniref:RNA polymerase sigma factor n=1 Tax=Evansella sp. AB-P1 TaxID=3037653 RepID=UPI00241FF730|nr:RNA polymerase sigma factor [Evansella sp. AB-P1]MDG5788392.1 RNA polymerase sigma factor [Evansella sp. AB-P1]